MPSATRRPGGGSKSIAAGDLGRLDADGTLVLTVTDTGPGITEADRKRIFDAGYRGEASGGTSGSGLGLALAKRFAEEHGGSIDVMSAPGAGAQFAVKLPGTERRAISSVGADGSISLL